MLNSEATKMTNYRIFVRGNRRTIRVRNNRTPIASTWTYDTFKKRSCVKFVPSPFGDIHKCICGRTQKNHRQRMGSHFLS